MKASACFIGHRKISDTPRCSRFGARSSRFVIAVRVSGGHLCEAEAPTEPAGETAV